MYCSLSICSELKCWNSGFQSDSVRSPDHWEVIRRHEWDSCLYRRGSKEASLLSCEDRVKKFIHDQEIGLGETNLREPCSYTSHTPGLWEIDLDHCCLSVTLFKVFCNRSLKLRHPTSFLTKDGSRLQEKSMYQIWLKVQRTKTCSWEKVKEEGH